MKKFILPLALCVLFVGCNPPAVYESGNDSTEVFKEAAGHPEEYFYRSGITDNKVWYFPAEAYENTELTLTDEECARILEILGDKLAALYKVTEYKKSDDEIALDCDIEFKTGDSSIGIFEDTIVMHRNGVEADTELEESAWKEIYSILNKNAGIPEEEEEEYDENAVLATKDEMTDYVTSRYGAAEFIKVEQNGGDEAEFFFRDSEYGFEYTAVSRLYRKGKGSIEEKDSTFNGKYFDYVYDIIQDKLTTIETEYGVSLDILQKTQYTLGDDENGLVIVKYKNNDLSSAEKAAAEIGRLFAQYDTRGFWDTKEIKICDNTDVYTYVGSYVIGLGEIEYDYELN